MASQLNAAQMQHTKTCLVSYLPTNYYGVLYFPLFLCKKTML